MFKKIVVLILVIVAFKGCTRDDLCPEGAATTPNLVITFNDFNNQSKRKKVVKLTIETDYEDSKTILSLIETDSIAIPLNVNSDTTKYRFVRITGTGDNAVINVDKLMFVYSRKDVYVTRACGFSTEFKNLNPSLEIEGSDNWIKLIETKRDTIIDEKKAHLTIFH